MATTLFRRDQHLPAFNHEMSTLTIALVVLVVVAMILVGILVLLRRRRHSSRLAPPSYEEKRTSTSSTSSHHRRVTARPSQSIHIFHDKEMSVDDYSTPSSPTSSLPEIRITFPEEVDHSGRRQSGRVVVVRVGDNGEGLEPMDDRLPDYEQRDSSFQSIDLERVGGLTEKELR